MSVYFVVQEEVKDQAGLDAYMEAAKTSTLGRGRALVVAVSYTHLTLPTKRIV